MQITFTKKLVAALVNGFEVPGMSYLQKVDRLAKVLGYANQAALMSALPKGTAVPDAPAVPETPRVVWPEPTFVPTKSGSDLNPDRVPFLYGAIKQELVIGEIMRLVEMLGEDIPDDEEDEMPEGILVTAGGTGQGKSTALAELLRNHMDARVLTVAENVRDTQPAEDDREAQISALEVRLTRTTELMEVIEGLMDAGEGAPISALSGRELALARKHEDFFRTTPLGTHRRTYEDLLLLAQRTADRLRFLDPAEPRHRMPRFPGDSRRHT